MSKKVLMKGNEAIAEAAVRAGCRLYFGYPITPQSEIPEYMSRVLPKVKGGAYIQAETEVSAINMVYGAAATGNRAMTTSSSPGVSLMMEGISYIAGAELPAVLVNIMRGGPGLGNINPEQADYFQAVKGGGHGSYRLVVLAPSSVQEMADLTFDAFDLADKYRNPVMIVAEGNLGQMMEPVVFREPLTTLPDHSSWALTGKKNREPHIVTSIYLQAEDMEN
ncbi:MAG: 3-methyl-2-oxobutanoate dehydrogenase subunit beta, partial [Candidatus Wallbacteria bacterium]|nr:3-methyl-2-oxobutanoate dehydrogenase subunit beta [Candidatus Wallbacteria bacterium]